MSRSYFNIEKTLGQNVQKVLVLLWICILFSSMFSGIFSSQYQIDSRIEPKVSNYLQNDLRLMFSKPISEEFQHSESLITNSSDTSLTTKPQENSNQINYTELSLTNQHKKRPNFKTAAIYELQIDAISPEAMEKNATLMNFILNFTIIGGGGITDPHFPNELVENITINNGSDPLDPLIWQDWTPLEDDKYSLTFVLTKSNLTRLDLGFYELTFHFRIFASGQWHYSSDSIPLPMKDLQISVISVSPSEFNNKLDSDQLFNISISVSEHDGTSLNLVGTLPTSYNPNSTILSSTSAGEIELLSFVRFVKYGNSSPFGMFTFEVNLKLSAVTIPLFPNEIHTLMVNVTSMEGIMDSNTIGFEASGTVFLIKIKEISIGQNPAIDYLELTQDGKEHEIRVNVNDSIHVSFYVWDNGTPAGPSMEEHLFSYQDPNRPDDLTAIIDSATSSFGNRTLTLVANKTTIASGYPLLIYVTGHKSSQELTPSNIMLYWDLLDYDYLYYDDRKEDGTGAKNSDNLKARGLDVGEVWTLNLTVSYLSDGSPALNAQISYRFTGNSWMNLTDGEPDDPLDGLFMIPYNTTQKEVILFECEIKAGSPYNPQGTLFVNKTYGQSNFSLTITWTYLIVDMIPIESDKRLNTDQVTGIDVTAIWAHDSTNFNGNLIGSDHEKGSQRPIVMTNGAGVWSGLIKTGSHSYNFSISSVDDDLFGITKFTNVTDLRPDERIVQTNIIWDDIEFTFSDRPPTEIDWVDNFYHTNYSFYTNFGENRTLYCLARHSYDRTRFSGTAALYDFDSGTFKDISFSNGTGIWVGNRTDARRPVLFRFMIIESEFNWNVTRMGTTGSNSPNNIHVIWDKVLVTLEANQTYSHGSWVNITVSLEYAIDSSRTVNPTSVNYTILLKNRTIHENISWTNFIDYSFNTTYHWYNISNLYDFDTGLTAFDILYRWSDKDMIPKLGNLTVYWVDDKDPSFLELQSFDLGNGTILVITDVTDDSEIWEGSGIGKVVLLDNRYDPGLVVPIPGESYPLPSGGYRFIFSISYNQVIENWGSTFQFNFDELLRYSVKVTDSGTINHPGDFNPPNNRSITSGILSILTIFDPFDPHFLKINGNEINISYLTMDSPLVTTNITDGSVVLTILVQDEIWSGLSTNSVELNITNTNSQESSSHLMTLTGGLGDGRAPLQFRWLGNLSVGDVYQINIAVSDKAGNINNFIKEMVIEDRVAPRIDYVNIEPTDDRKLFVSVDLAEAGLGVEYVTVGIVYPGNVIEWFNLSRQGGIGAQQDSGSSLETYSAIIPLTFDLLDMVSPKTYSITIKVLDRAGNFKLYDSEELRDIWGQVNHVSLNPLILHPVVLAFSGVLLIVAIVVGIRITSKTEGYDMKKIFNESERIPREIILTQMDEFALGVTVNFFDQVQGPVPVIWEPPLLEDQEQVMLDLSDKSFSTLEFVGLEEVERSGTFDFSTGSYDCTALGYSFSVDNPQARGGKENLTIVLLLRKEWGDNLLTFQDELLNKLRIIRKMIVTQQSSFQIEKEARQLREYVSRLMIAFNKLYIGSDYELDSSVE